MPIQSVPLPSLLDALRGAAGDGPWSAPATRDVLVVDLDVVPPDEPLPPLHTGVPAVVVGLTAQAPPERHPAAPVCDVVLPHGDDALAAVARRVASNPIASASFVLLLRGSERRSLDDGLLAESAVYSTLQAGPEFMAWRAARVPKDRPRAGDPVVLARHGDSLHITVNRPDVRNALNTEMRDQLVAAFLLPALDGSITDIHMWGEGESFCAGGDLDEFGSFPDPATAHLVRLRQSVGRSIAAVAARVTAHVHGACFGSGIELPAFAGTVTADRSATMALPEVGLGLIPGAGGTVSLPARIGRHRTARLGLTGERIDAATALAWGLIDNVDDAPGSAQAVS
jgi:enoyl-CoA hydratase/carnithine racemase